MKVGVGGDTAVDGHAIPTVAAAVSSEGAIREGGTGVDVYQARVMELMPPEFSPALDTGCRSGFLKFDITVSGRPS